MIVSPVGCTVEPPWNGICNGAFHGCSIGLGSGEFGGWVNPLNSLSSPLSCCTFCGVPELIVLLGMGTAALGYACPAVLFRCAMHVKVNSSNQFTSSTVHCNQASNVIYM